MLDFQLNMSRGPLGPSCQQLGFGVVRLNGEGQPGKITNPAQAVSAKLPRRGEVKPGDFGAGGVQHYEKPIGIVDVAGSPVTGVDDDHLVGD